MTCNSILASCGFSQILNSGASFLESNKTPVLITISLVALGALYARQTKSSYVDQLFAKRITYAKPSNAKSSMTPKEQFTEHFHVQGYNHLAVVSDKDKFDNPINQLAQYVKNPKKFDKAVAEFAKLMIENCHANLCKSVHEVVPSAVHVDKWYNDTSNCVAASLSSIGNYPSFPLYLENGDGKIGIKNPNFPINIDKLTRSLAISARGNQLMHELLQFFPFHKNIILDVLRNILPSTEVNHSSLDKKIENQKKVLIALSSRK